MELFAPQHQLACRYLGFKLSVVGTYATRGEGVYSYHFQRMQWLEVEHFAACVTFSSRCCVVLIL